MNDERARAETYSEKRTAGESNSLPWLVAGLLVAVAALWLGYFRPWFPAPLHDPSAEPREVTPRGDFGAGEAATIALFSEARKSVVHITTRTYGRSPVTRNLFQMEGAGTGFVWDENGHIVTNYHVVDGAQEVTVRVDAGETYSARFVGGAPDRDIAVLKIETTGGELPPLAIGGSADLEVGQSVYAIGNPFGLDQTLTTGVISGIGREIPARGDGSTETIPNAIQTDAAINPGNSGGPLLDSAGRLIGMNTAIYSPSGAYAGVGFAIAVDDINRIVPQLIRTGRVEQVGLGIRIAADDWQQKLVEQKDLSESGVLVWEVVPGGPADEAGLQPTVRVGNVIELGDLIVAADGEPIQETRDLFDFLEGKSAGDEVTLTVVRGEEKREVTVTLAVLSEFEA